MDAVTSSSIAAAVGDTSPMTVSADAALLLAQQHQQQQDEAASAVGITLDDSYMKDDGASFMKVDDAADASSYLKDTNDALVKDEEPSSGLSTDSASGLTFHLNDLCHFYRLLILYVCTTPVGLRIILQQDLCCFMLDVGSKSCRIDPLCFVAG